MTSSVGCNLKIRKAIKDDLRGITEIYNEAIVETVATFDTKPKTMREQVTWFGSHNDKYPICVSELDGAVVGWAALSPWSDRCAYKNTAEISIYVTGRLQKQGMGKRLMSYILNRGKQAGLHTVIARVSEGNQHSIILHRKFGFEIIGNMKEVGMKFNRLIDVTMMQKMFGN